ncbi:nucleotidyltransferase substrate binding protein [Roseiflexus castenholzii]|jgi:nucleotidyltransferase substrate binding protein (TIGR01987 family)|uniref:Nucleotidyltransferase substrate binding protein, HI0074 family n=1 Tax=Roseiflexus castenholzii (strain DSM 13941 / HLO8) TaxID=383372 RepID=A7NIK5_ROSCS|nr:nucleotidyltransferase substrate binding protein [Roseiflexus castenholzii]ABU57305.1 nucleotidyltransferase substrate binding protein, HI0074 family [Roseiflexus castenholzii DSM 13941]
MSAPDARLRQRLSSFRKALSRLHEAVNLAAERPLSRLEEQGLIQAFKFTHELAWNVLKDFLELHGVAPLYGSKDTTREAFKRGLLDQGDLWMDMIRDRNLTSHTYNEETAVLITRSVIQHYFPQFVTLSDKMEQLLAEMP